jgi:drug/metabolite transporter (DMT)-like permease
VITFTSGRGSTPAPVNIPHRTAATMTTESQQHTPRGVSPLLGAASAGLVLVVLAVVLAGGLGGRPSPIGAAAGGVLALVVFATGTAVVQTVARAMPSASLLVALMTYTLQVVLMGAVAMVLARSGLVGDELSRGWFAGAVIGVTLTWMMVQVWLVGRQRIPVYDLSADVRPGGER